MYHTKMKIKEFSFLSTEDFIKVHNHKPKTIIVTTSTPSKDYTNTMSEEAYFGNNNEFTTTLIFFMKELRELYYNSIDNKNSLKNRKKFSKDILPLVSKMEDLICKTFNVWKCYFSLSTGYNSWSVPMCFDSELLTSKGDEVVINKKFKASLEDIVETKKGYKYKDPYGKIYLITFGLGSFGTRSKELLNDRECAGIILHELGHAMQQAVCSINENLASLYINRAFRVVYKCLEPLKILTSGGRSVVEAVEKNKEYKELSNIDNEIISEELLKAGVKEGDVFNRKKMSEEYEKNKHTVIDSLYETPKKKFLDKDSIFVKILTFIFGGLFKIIGSLLTTIISIPRYSYAASQSKFLSKQQRFEQFCDIFATLYGLGPDLSSALSKLYIKGGSKPDYGLFNIINYISLANVIVNSSHYINFSMSLLQYPSLTGRMVSMYKALKSELDNNKDLSKEERDLILNEINSINEIYNEYVFDWSPKGFVYALWHKVTFKNLENEKSNVQENVLDALKEISKEEEFKGKVNKTEPKSLNTIDLFKVTFDTVKSLTRLAPIGHKELISMIEPYLRKI
ncbi:MAG: hypothetical protein ACRC5M_06890 [Anaeroplasmataceae bacterium]